MPHQKLFDIFKNYQIEYELHEHVQLFTAEDSHKLPYEIKGAHCKNLFLRDKRKCFFLVTVLSSKRVDLKALSNQHGAGHFSFGNELDMQKLLGVSPGSVTPYGLIHDKYHQVNFLIDKDLMNHDYVNFHPLRNDMTVGVTLNTFFTFFDQLGRKPEIIDVPIIAS